MINKSMYVALNINREGQKEPPGLCLASVPRRRTALCPLGCAAFAAALFG